MPRQTKLREFSWRKSAFGRQMKTLQRNRQNQLSPAMHQNQHLPSGTQNWHTYDEILAGLTDTAALDADLQRLELEKDGILQRITDLIHENATTKMDQGEYNRRYDGLETQRIAISEKQKRIKEKLSDKLFRKRKLEAFVSELKSAEQLIYFDEQLFVRTVEQITVFPDKLVFVFKDGTEIPVEE